jgi:hypothetical protein
MRLWFGVLGMVWNVLVLFGAAWLWDMAARSAVGGAWTRVRVAVRLRAVLPVVWWVRGVRRRTAYRWRVRTFGLRTRWGYLRHAVALTRVCVPVWVTRYQVWERLDRVSGGAASWFRVAVALNFGR